MNRGKGRKRKRERERARKKTELYEKEESILAG
jgi:hypothetical protein